MPTTVSTTPTLAQSPDGNICEFDNLAIVLGTAAYIFTFTAILFLAMRPELAEVIADLVIF